MCFGISFCPNVLLGLFPFIFPAVSVDCCASLVGAWLFCQGQGAHPGPSQVRLLLPAWGLCVLLGMLPCLHGGLQEQSLLGPLSPLDSCEGTLKCLESCCAWPQPCVYCQLPLSVFVYSHTATKTSCHMANPGCSVIVTDIGLFLHPRVEKHSTRGEGDIGRSIMSLWCPPHLEDFIFSVQII